MVATPKFTPTLLFVPVLIGSKTVISEVDKNVYVTAFLDAS